MLSWSGILTLALVAAHPEAATESPAVSSAVVAPATGGGVPWCHESQAPTIAAITGKAICYYVRNNGALKTGGT